MITRLLSCTLFVASLMFCTSCSDKLDKTCGKLHEYQKDLAEYYKNGDIDSLQKDRAEKYYRRAINITKLENIYSGKLVSDEELQNLWYVKYFTCPFHEMTYRELIDSASVALKPWPGKKITRAVALSSEWGVPIFFLKEGKGEQKDFLPEDYTLNPKAKQKELTSVQIQELLDGMNGYWPVGSYTPHTTPDCFYGLDGILLYDEKDKYVAYIELCFNCSQYHIHPRGLWRAEEGVFKEKAIQEQIHSMNPFEKVLGKETILPEWYKEMINNK